jgi:hypothetical protein
LGVKRVYRKFDAPRDRPARTFDSDRPARKFTSDRPARGDSKGASKPAGDFAPRKFSKPAGDFKPRKFAGKPDGDFKPRKFAGKSSGDFKPRKPGGSFAGKATSTFAKFSGGKKPFGKRPPARKFKPKGESE